MNLDSNNIFSDEEKEILQEIMNIAFGNATADLAEVIDIYVVLSVPNIRVIGMKSLPEFITEKISDYTETSIVVQRFWGDFAGSGLLVFPDKAGEKLVSILDHEEMDNFGSKPIDSLETEVLIEIGNILSGACIGKISELLDTFVSYTTPEIIREKSGEFKTFLESFDINQKVIIMETHFKFEKKDLTGLLLIVTSQDSIEWLRKALCDFMEPYQ